MAFVPCATAALLLTLGLPPLLEEAEQQNRAAHLLATAQLQRATMAASAGADKAAGTDTDPDPGTDLSAIQHAEVIAATLSPEAFETLPRDEDGIPVVTDLDAVLELAPPTFVPDRSTWIRHRVRPRERVTQIAARYGVSAHDVVEWNRLDPKAVYPKGHWRVRVRAHRIPAPRIRVDYVVTDNRETWGDIAARFFVEQPDLRAWNWQRRSLSVGRRLVLWVDPGAPKTIHPDQGPPVPETFDIPAGGLSKGYPDRGRLIGGVMLPPSELYTKRVPDHGLWGSTNTLQQLQLAFATFRHDTGYEGKIVVGAISRRHGGRFSPHLSHQSGRDVDIRLPRLPGVPTTASEPNADEVDWHATWGLIRALDGTGQVGRIFLEVGLHRRLYEAARQLGETPEAIAELLPWPVWKTKGHPVVRHSRGHDGHIHVRFRCGSEEPRCRSRKKR